jgi:hypothetical protein
MRASWSRVCLLRRDSHWAIRFQCPGGVSDPGPSAQYTAILFGQRPNQFLSTIQIGITLT